MKQFEKFTQRQIKSLIHHLKKYEENGDREILHQVRVDIKKIKAILAAINSCVKDFKAHKSFIPFRDIFRRAGQIRDPDVLARLLLKYPTHGITHDVAPVNVEQLESAFKLDTPYLVSVLKRNHKKLKTFSRQVQRDDFTGYLTKKKKEVKSQLCPWPKMVNIHKMRKSIKEIVYLSEVGNKTKRKETRFYDKMQDIIGRLHDKQVLLDFLTNNHAASHNQRELIKSECLVDKKEMFNLVRDYY